MVTDSAKRGFDVWRTIHVEERIKEGLIEKLKGVIVVYGTAQSIIDRPDFKLSDVLSKDPKLVKLSLVQLGLEFEQGTRIGQQQIYKAAFSLGLKLCSHATAIQLCFEDIYAEVGNDHWVVCIEEVSKDFSYDFLPSELPLLCLERTRKIKGIPLPDERDLSLTLPPLSRGATFENHPSLHFIFAVQE